MLMLNTNFYRNNWTLLALNLLLNNVIVILPKNVKLIISILLEYFMVDPSKLISIFTYLGIPEKLFYKQ